MDKVTALQDPRNSLPFWHELALQTKVPMPATLIFEAQNPTLEEWMNALRMGEDIDIPWINHLIGIIDEEIGFPVFVRDNELSEKFKFMQTCYIKSSKHLRPNIANILMGHAGKIAGGMPPPTSLILREYLPPAPVVVDGVEYSPFGAFGRKSQLRIGAERRYFVCNGEVECHHPYWLEESIRGETSVDNWQAQLEMLNLETEPEIQLLTDYSQQLGVLLDGYWSLDYLWAVKDGKARWVFIDAGLGDCSEHDPSCPFYQSY